MSIKNKRRYVVSLHKSPSQTKDEFDVFLISFEQVIGDIIAEKSFVQIKTNWWKNDLSTSEDTQVDSLTTSYGLSQIISDPTHILPNSSSCFDLFFTNQPNLVTESGPQSRDPLRKTSIGNCPLNELIHLRYQKPFGRNSQTLVNSKKIPIIPPLLPCYPVDTGRKLNVHKTFRRRPGRLLKVLCTFNLHPVTTG